MSELKSTISAATTAAMKARDKARVGVLRLVNSELKRVEVDERRELTDDDVLAILNRMLKQRADSLSQYEKAGREDLAAQERFEIDLVREFMPEAMSAGAVEAAVVDAIAKTGAIEMRDMGKVMGVLKASVGGRADMGQVSALVKAKLSG